MFISGIYFNPKSKQFVWHIKCRAHSFNNFKYILVKKQPHGITHVEIMLGKLRFILIEIKINYENLLFNFNIISR